jgi:hypothetical protein
MKLCQPIRVVIRYSCLVGILIYFSSCSTSRKVAENELGNGRYVFKQSGRLHEKIELQVQEDSLTIIREEDGEKIIPERDDLTF